MDFIYFLGRFHVLALHLPIGIICVVVLLEFLSRYDAFKHLALASNYLWIVATVTAFATVVLGLMHRAEGGFDGPSMVSHAQWGIGTAVFCLLIVLLKTFTAQFYLKLQTILGGWMLLMVAMTGHYGGNLTHGSTYLFAYAPKILQSVAGIDTREPVTDISQADVFYDVVNPLVQQRCSGCHNNDKFKGQLSLASYELMLTGGESGPAVVPGNITASEMLTRISLEQEHEDFMPADGKTPLTAEQVRILGWWVENGAPKDRLLLDMSPPSDILVSAQTYLGLAEIVDNGIVKAVAAADSDIRAARELGFLIRKMSQQSNLLEVDMSVQGGDLTLAHIEVLNALAPQVYKLSLKNTNLNDSQLLSLNDLPNLLMLNLAETQLTDQSFEPLQALYGLQVLNIFGNSRMSEQGLKDFTQTTSIARVYAWGIGH